MRKYALFFIILIIASCNDHEKKSDQSESNISNSPDSLAIELNNKAVKLMGDAAHTYDSLSGILYDSAIVYLEQAIAIDSLYLLAYTNKAQALRRKGFLEESLQVLEQAENIKPDFAEVISAQGFLLEKMGKIELANLKYDQAHKAYEERLEKNPKNDKVKSEIAFLYIFLKSKNLALDEIRNLILENPDSEQLKNMERIINNFDRKKFIEEY
jgi:tetratricopeptide (TPR) repeat protein